MSEGDRLNSEDEEILAKEDFSDSSSVSVHSDQFDDDSDLKPSARKSSNISKFTNKEIIRMIGAVLEFG